MDTTTITVTAANRVWNTVELFEMIMLECTMDEIAHLREINSHFKQVIEQSTVLRQALFLDPVRPKSYHSTSDPTDHMHRLFKTKWAVMDKNTNMPPNTYRFHCLDLFRQYTCGPLWEKMLINRMPHKQHITVESHLYEKPPRGKGAEG